MPVYRLTFDFDDFRTRPLRIIQELGHRRLACLSRFSTRRYSDSLVRLKSNFLPCINELVILFLTLRHIGFSPSEFQQSEKTLYGRGGPPE